MRGELGTHLREAGLPTIVVTHDFNDAAALADRTAVLVAGKVVQIGAPGELIAAPATPFVAELAGGNLLPGHATRRARRLDRGRSRRRHRGRAQPTSSRDAWASWFSHGRSRLRAKPLWTRCRTDVRARIASIVPVGNRVRVRIGPLTAEITAASAAQLGLRNGETAVASFKATATRLTPLG